ncbi:MAG: M14 family metallopeptidase [Campylobacterota bacterium]|nr:M14 family metallopeptidase [Campylobacterota bacterium]
MIPLIEIDRVPEELLTIKDARELHKLMPHPTLLSLEGEHKQPLFVTILLHGNEDTGLFAIQKILHKYQERRLPRSLIIFFGNLYAAKEGLRRLEGQPDYNRVWPGGDAEESDEGRLMARVIEIVKKANLFASIDIHNNTGKNPHYGCINRLDPNFFHLASLFARTVVYFETPKGVQSLALAEYCPAVTIECGKPHQARGVDHATEFVDMLLHLTKFPKHHLHRYEVDVYHTVARVTIPEEYTYSFGDDSSDIRLLPELEDDNFSELPAGTIFAYLNPESKASFSAQDDDRRERFDEYFVIDEGEIRLKKEMMPSMITLDERVIRQDCFCYLMERIALPE